MYTTSERELSGPRVAEHWPALDGLRGLAVAAVVAFHLGWWSGGFLGVDLFFTLSGFLITSVIIREWRATGRLDLREFWARRARRLLPAVALLIAVILAFLTVWGTAAEQASARSDATWALPYLANWHLIAAARDYWADATTLSVFNHLWSLAIEEQFYVVWPLVAWLVLRRGGERALLALALVGSVVSAAAMVVLSHTDAASRVYFGTDTRVVALLLGAAAATEPVRRRCGTWREGAPRVAETLTWVAGATLAVGWCIGGRFVGALVGGGLAVHAAVATTLVVLLAATPPQAGTSARRTRPASVLSRPVLAWLGQRSYGIYLWHWPVIQLIEPRWHRLSAGVRDIGEVVLTLLLAEVSYRLVEHPVRRRTGWAVGRRAAVFTTAGVLVAAAVTVLAPSGRGHVASFELAAVPPAARPPVTPAVEPSSTEVPAASTSVGRPVPSVVELLAANAALTGAPDGTVARADADAAPSPRSANGTVGVATARHIERVLWVGDSVAADLGPAVVASLGAAGVEVIDRARDGAHLVPTEVGDDPHGFYGPMVRDTAADAVVVQLSHWDAPASLDDLRHEFGWFAATVRATGADLVFVTPPPVRDDLADPAFEHVLTVAAELVSSDPLHVHLIDTTGVWGATMQRDMDGDGAPDRKPDGVHVCPQGAARFAAWAVDALDAVFDGVAPTFPSAWVGGDWQQSDRYDTPVGACAALGPGSDD
jgi:peptidoglycan/LPS O-acetylase OafA/YrhL